MRINHNVAAFNTYSRLTSATINQAKSLEKLSSGLRINKSGDDAAGLAISEKMRGQIRGLDQAVRNSQDGISMIQTAEGALSETHSILQRMRELAVQASNDTNTSADRNEIQKEVNQLSTEINRIGNNTEFNTKKLLDGTYAASSASSGVTTAATTTGKDATQAKYTVTLTSTLASGATFAWDSGGDNVVATATGAAGTMAAADFIVTNNRVTNANALASSLNQQATFSSKWTAADNGDGSITITARADAAKDGTAGNSVAVTMGGVASTTELTTAISGTAAATQVNTITLASSALTEGMKINIGDKTFALWDSSKGTYQNDAAAKIGLDAHYVYNVANASFNTATEIATAIAAVGSSSGAAIASTDAVLTVTATVSGVDGVAGAAVSSSGGSSSNTAGSGVTLQIGANSDQSFNIYFENMKGTAIEVTNASSGATIQTSDGKTAQFSSTQEVIDGTAQDEYALDVSSATAATAAISAIDDAITSVSAERSKLGAYQNRLEHTIANLGTSSENLSAAESRVRDVDMAKEMMEFTKNNILNQAATAMLAQANQQPQGVLQLLR